MEISCEDDNRINDKSQTIEKAFILAHFLIYKKAGEKKDEYIIKRYKFGNNYNLEVLRFISDMLKSDRGLSQDQKFKYCNNQRYFMRLYLEEMKKRREKTSV